MARCLIIIIGSTEYPVINRGMTRLISNDIYVWAVFSALLPINSLALMHERGIVGNYCKWPCLAYSS